MSGASQGNERDSTQGGSQSQDQQPPYGHVRSQMLLDQHLNQMDQELKQKEGESHNQYMERVTRIGVSIARNLK